MRAYKQPMLERKVQVLCFDQTLAEAQIRGKLAHVQKEKSLREDIKKLFRSDKEVGDTFEVQLVWKDQVVDPSMRGTVVDENGDMFEPPSPFSAPLVTSRVFHANNFMVGPYSINKSYMKSLTKGMVKVKYTDMFKYSPFKASQDNEGTWTFDAAKQELRRWKKPG